VPFLAAAVASLAHAPSGTNVHDSGEYVPGDSHCRPMFFRRSALAYRVAWTRDFGKTWTVSR
jgi:hypothetical protein